VDKGLKTATTIVGLLAGVATAVYVLGGLVVALRLISGDFSVNSAAMVVGQLPRELVVTTAMLHVLLPAITAGLVFGMAAAIVARARGIDLRPARDRPGAGQVLLIVLCAVVLMAPAVWRAVKAEGPTLSALVVVIGGLFTVFAAYAGWHLLRRIDDAAWSPAGKLCAGGALFAAVALVPAAMYSASFTFEPAQVCTADRQAPEQGGLIGEGGGRILLAEEFGHEASVLSIPSERVVKTEYGDLSSTFACPAPAGEGGTPTPPAKLGGHGGEEELRLAMALRPRLRFDSRERWRPIGVAAFLTERFEGVGHHACLAGADPPCPLTAELRQLGRGPGAAAYLDVQGAPRDVTSYASPDEGCRRSPPALDCNSGPGAVIYYRRTTHEGRWYWDYWWFLRYNDYTGRINHCVVVCGDHEGDWEGITVITTPAAEPEILGAIYAAHRDRALVDAVTLPTASGHPLVWIASGTHASYPFDCDGGCRQYNGLPEDPHDGAVPWGGNRDSECAATGCVRPLPEVGDPSEASLPIAGSWAGWPGKWGETCHDGCPGPRHRESSPASPGTQVRFQCPWVPTRRAKPAPDGSGLSDSDPVGDGERLLALCLAQRGGR
jgi:hypothetical protein